MVRTLRHLHRKSADPLSHIHPELVIAAMPQGCVPDLVLPATLEDRAASEEFATLLVRSLGVPLLDRGRIYAASAESPSHLIFRLDGAFPYQLPGETCPPFQPGRLSHQHWPLDDLCILRCFE